MFAFLSKFLNNFAPRKKKHTNDMEKNKDLALQPRSGRYAARHAALLLALFALTAMPAGAQFTSEGNGTTYSFASLAAIDGSGVTFADGKYHVADNITIAIGDHFTMDAGATVLLADNVTLTISGTANFSLASGSTIGTSSANETHAAAIRLESSATTDISNVTFNGVGLEMRGGGAVNVTGCHFNGHDGSTAAALYFVSAGAPSAITDCTFASCRKAAIGSAANASQPLTITGCTLLENSTANGNVPQINITAANPLIIADCTIEGNAQNTKVGGIGISNFMGYNANVSIARCTVSNNRYGIGLVGPAAKIRIDDCILTDNCHETDPMQGGSGISLYDPYLLTQAVIAGNTIEGSLWGITVIGCKDVNIGQPGNSSIQSPGGNVFRNNGFDGNLYDLYNNSTLTIYAQNNTWNVANQTEEEIEKVIFHQHDDASLGEVIFMPAANATAISHHSAPSRACGRIFSLDGTQRQTMQRGINIVDGRVVIKD